MTEYVSCHSIIYETEDDDGRIKYYTTNMDFNHSWLCEVDIEDLDEIKPDFKVEYTRMKGEIGNFVLCPICHGGGKMDDCINCDGDGYVEESK